MSKSLTGLRGGLAVVVSAQLVGCATTRDVTRGAGIGLAALGALTVMAAFAPEDCEDEWEADDWMFGHDGECEAESEEELEEELEERGALLAGGTAAVLLGGGLVAVSTPPKRKAPRRLSAKPVPSNARPPAQGNGRVMRELIEKRCLPEEDAVDLRVLPRAQRTSLPVCGEP